MREFKIGNRVIGKDHPTYFIADIGSNHDGDLGRAVSLIWLAADVGIDAVKFQHFRASELISDEGFKALGAKLGHQTSWKESIFETYQKYEVPWDWTPHLAAECKKAGVDFLSTPYDLEAVDHLDPYVSAFKIGSGDITYFDLLDKVVNKGKPVILSTGASTQQEAWRAIRRIEWSQLPITVLQCNTNYTGSFNDFQYANLNVLKEYVNYADIVGLSDHLPGHVAVLGAVALGARIIEKHFTDDQSRLGPDHGFALDYEDWELMIRDVRRLEAALGDGIKKVEDNEKEARIIQRRGLYGGKWLRPAHD